MNPDNWNSGLGSDSEVTPVKVSEKTKNTNLALMVHFKGSIPFKVNGEVNILALMALFKTLRTNAVSYSDIHKMINRFFEEIKNKPLPYEVPTWKAFIQRKDELIQWVTTNSPDSDVSEWK